MRRLFPIPEAMAIGFGLLRLSPDAFWRMTPRELDAAISGLCGHFGSSRPQADELKALMARFPDQTELEPQG